MEKESHNFKSTFPSPFLLYTHGFREIFMVPSGWYFREDIGVVVIRGTQEYWTKPRSWRLRLL
jgi:hypothetical protein